MFIVYLLVCAAACGVRRGSLSLALRTPRSSIFHFSSRASPASLPLSLSLVYRPDSRGRAVDRHSRGPYIRSLLNVEKSSNTPASCLRSYRMPCCAPAIDGYAVPRLRSLSRGCTVARVKVFIYVISRCAHPRISRYPAQSKYTFRCGRLNTRQRLLTSTTVGFAVRRRYQFAPSPSLRGLRRPISGICLSSVESIIRRE